MNKKRLYISLILATILFNACGGEDATIKEEIDKMTPPQSAYSQEEVTTDKSLDTKEAIVEKNDLRELLIGQQYYITLKDKENNINHFSWKFTKDGISSTKLNGYTKTTLIPYQINENILSVSIDDQAKIFTFEAEDSDYLIFEDKKEDIRFYNSVNKSNIFFNKLKEENVITDKPTTKSELTKAIEGNTFFLPATKDGKKALFKLDFQKNGIVIINGIEGYSLMMEIAYKVEDKTLKFNSDQRVFDSDKGDYLLFTDNSRMYKNQTNAKIYLDTL
jgi:hypothetical protein